ncbi:MAG: hypothetical protein AAF957_03280 [Planctomycetota bacterium]
MRFAVSLATFATLSSVALSQITVGALDGTRCRALSANGTFGYDIIRNELTAPSFQAAAGFSVTIGPEASTLSAGYLAGVDVLFIGDSNDFLSPTEAADLAAWHAAGGGLFLIADSSSPGLATSCLAAIGSPYAYGGTACGSGSIGNPISMDDYTLTNGPFGDLRGQDLSMTLTASLAGIAAADIAAECNDGSVTFAKHDAGDINGSTSGAVVMSGDASFIGLFTDPASATFFSQVNIDFCLNAFVYLSDGGGTLGTNYCMANPNSTGVPAVISADGSRSAAANDVTLTTTDMPNNAFGFYLVSSMQGFTPNPGGSAGNLCLSGMIGRYVGPGQIQNSGLTGEISLVLDLTMTPQPMGFISIMAGDVFNFTTWFRDTSMMGGATSNFSDGISITFI